MGGACGPEVGVACAEVLGVCSRTSGASSSGLTGASGGAWSSRESAFFHSSAGCFTSLARSPFGCGMTSAFSFSSVPDLTSFPRKVASSFSPALSSTPCLGQFSPRKVASNRSPAWFPSSSGSFSLISSTASLWPRLALFRFLPVVALARRAVSSTSLASASALSEILFSAFSSSFLRTAFHLDICGSAVLVSAAAASASWAFVRSRSSRSCRRRRARRRPGSSSSGSAVDVTAEGAGFVIAAPAGVAVAGSVQTSPVPSPSRCHSKGGEPTRCHTRLWSSNEAMVYCTLGPPRPQTTRALPWRFSMRIRPRVTSVLPEGRVVYTSSTESPPSLRSNE
mmetsp:Transcript_6823/g.14814  ORF Transcript_6823/g.14814 Transcript_6823/m.14814 type:complete len:338 (+) Transcript_6823:747-1760(+)